MEAFFERFLEAFLDFFLAPPLIFIYFLSSPSFPGPTVAIADFSAVSAALGSTTNLGPDADLDATAGPDAAAPDAATGFFGNISLRSAGVFPRAATI